MEIVGTRREKKRGGGGGKCVSFFLIHNDNMAELMAIDKMSKGIYDCRINVDHVIGAC